MGDINWIRPQLRLTTGDLQPLFNILRGEADPTSPREMTKEGLKALDKVETAINEQQILYVDYTQPWEAYILPTNLTPTAVLWQKGPLRWIHLPVSPMKVLNPYHEAVALLVQLCRGESIKYFGKETQTITVPFTMQQIDWLFQHSDTWGIAFANFSGKIGIHYPNDKLLHFAMTHAFIFPKIVQQQPIKNAVLVFTDGSSNGRATYVIGDQPHVILSPPASAQVVELRAVSAVFQTLHSVPFNLYTDSYYVAQSVD